MTLRIAVVGIDPENMHFLTYTRYLAERGHDVTAITNRDTVDAPVKVVNFGRHTRLIKLVPSVFRVLLRAWRVRRAIRRGRFDVVSIQQVTPDGVYAAVLSDAPVVPTFWGSDILRLEIRPWFVRKLMPVAIRRSAFVHATCEEIERRAIEMGAEPEKVETFNYGIDLDVFAATGPETREPHRVLCTRGLRPFYRIPELVRAFPRVLERFPDATLVLAGSGWEGDREALEGLVAEEGLGDRVAFTGRLDAAGVASELRRAAVWVSIPPSDSFALSLQEAMACGALPVVTDLPAMREGVDESRAVFVTDAAPEPLAAAIALAIERAAAGEHVAPNREVVEARGNRRINLARFEALLVLAAETRGARR